MDKMLLPYRRYAEFDGRSSRSEYWMFMLFYVLVVIGVILLMVPFLPAETGAGNADLNPGFIIVLMLFGVFILGSIIPSIAVTVRRLHDQDKSGWWYFISFVPYVGSFILLVMMCIEGTRGENQYGPDPLGPDYGSMSAGYRG